MTRLNPSVRPLSIFGKLSGDVAFFGLAVGFVVLMQTPFAPSFPQTGLDPLWMQVLTHAWRQQLEWGRDIVFSYGPFGWVMAGYDAPETFIPRLLIRLVISVWTGALLGGLLLQAGARARWAALIAIVSVWQLTGFDVVMLSACLLLLLWPWAVGSERVRLLGTAAAAILCGFFSMVKLSVLPVAAVTAVLVDVIRIQRRQSPVAVLAMALSLSAFYLMGRVSLQSIPIFLIGTGEIISGFSEAMSTQGPVFDLLVYVVLSGVILGTVFFSASMRHRLIVIRAAGLALILWIGLKAGMVRHDGQHATIAFGIVCVAAVLMVSIHGRAERVSRLSRMLLCLAAAAGFVMAFCARERIAEGLGRRSVVALIKAPYRQAQGAGLLFSGRARATWHQAFTARRAELQSRCEMGFAQGTYDIFPWDPLGPLLRDDGNWRGRPIFQSYKSYTSWLAARNAAYLRSDLTGPDELLVCIKTIDGRLPAMDDGASWPVMLEHYDLVAFDGEHVRMRRRVHPRSIDRERIMRTRVRRNDEIQLPRHEGLAMARLEITPTLLGRLVNILYKTPWIYIRIRDASGNETRHRLLRRIAAHGFPLSPLVTTTTDFAGLAIEPDTLGSIGGDAIDTFMIYYGKYGRLFYKPDIELTVDVLTYGEIPEAIHADRQPTEEALLEVTAANLREGRPEKALRVITYAREAGIRDSRFTLYELWAQVAAGTQPADTNKRIVANDEASDSLCMTGSMMIRDGFDLIRQGLGLIVKPNELRPTDQAMALQCIMAGLLALHADISVHYAQATNIVPVELSHPEP